MDIKKYQQLSLSIEGSRNAREILRNQNLKLIIDNSTDAIAIYDTDGRVLYINKAFEDTFGWKSEDISENHTSVIPMDEIDTFKNMLNQAGSGKIVRNYKCKRLHKNGRIIPIRINVLPLHGGNEEINAIVEMSSEIIDRDIEKSDTDKGDLYSKIIERSSDGIFIIRNGLIEFTNSAMEKIFGYSNGQMIGMEFLDLIVNENKAIIWEIHRRILSKEFTPIYEVRALKNDGQEIVIEANFNLIDENRIVGILRDVTDKRKLHDTLKENEGRYRKIFKISPEIIVFLNTKGDILDVSDTIHKILGYKPEEVIGKNITNLEFLSEEGRKTIMEKFSQRIQGMEMSPYEIGFITKEGKTVIGRIHASPLIDNNGKIVGDLAVIVDVTELRDMQDELEDKIHQLEVFHRTAVDRELKIKELKERVKELEKKNAGR